MAKKKAAGDPEIAARPAARTRPNADRKTLKMEVTRDMIAKRAYELYVARGKVDGYAQQDWRQAEQELRSKIAQ